MKCGIYSIKLNNEVLYVGQSCNMPRRWSFHRWQLRRGIHSNSYLQNIYKKYENIEFSVEEFVADKRFLTERERYHIKNLKPRCNFILPGRGDSWIFSEERNYKISVGNSGKLKSAEHRRNISLSKMGNKNPMYGKQPWNIGIGDYIAGNRNPFYGKKHSYTTKKLISDANRKDVDSKKILELRDSGLSFEKIAIALSVSRKTVSRRYYEHKQITD